MKRAKVIFWLLIVLIMAGLLLWLLQHRPNALPPIKQEPAVAPATNAPSIAITQASNNESPPYPAKPADLPESAWARMLTYFEQTKSQNSPLEFYARAVDQNGNPVSGATLNLEISRFDERWIFRPDLKKVTDENLIQHKKIDLISAADGRFSYTEGKGIGIDIISVGKYGYYWERPSTMGTFDYAGGRRVGNTWDMTNAFNHDTGYSFHLWKKGEMEPLIPISGQVKMNYEIQGQWVSNYFVQFAPARVEWTNFDGADLAIKGVRRSSGNADRPYEFTFTLFVPNGGMLISEDSYAYLAPSAGYQSSWTFENKPQNSPPDFPWTKTTYFKLRGGKMYAGVRLGFCNNGFSFSLDGYLNPNGSRNLEPDPDKLINDSEEIRRIDKATRIN